MRFYINDGEMAICLSADDVDYALFYYFFGDTILADNIKPKNWTNYYLSLRWL